eukprot:GHVU01194649.1.p1 GENE.GHVU01194649.1~~GHVU01194649.1.p1  ORF type:complete len:265 (-),score=41.24 GHVU01194649.1:145-939(-)
MQKADLCLPQQVLRFKMMRHTIAELLSITDATEVAAFVHNSSAGAEDASWVTYKRDELPQNDRRRKDVHRTRATFRVSPNNVRPAGSPPTRPYPNQGWEDLTRTQAPRLTERVVRVELDGALNEHFKVDVPDMLDTLRDIMPPAFGSHYDAMNPQEQEEWVMLILRPVCKCLARITNIIAKFSEASPPVLPAQLKETSLRDFAKLLDDEQERITRVVPDYAEFRRQAQQEHSALRATVSGTQPGVELTFEAQWNPLKNPDGTDM